MLTTIAAALILAPQLQKYTASFRVETHGEGGSVAQSGTSSWSGVVGFQGNRNVVWSFQAADGKSGWRREWTYSKDGALTFEAYEVVFGDVKSRWTLARTKEGWEFSKAGQVTRFAASLRLEDKSMLWFASEKAAVGAEAPLGGFDPIGLKAIRGTASYLRVESWPGERDSKAVHVIRRTLGDQIDEYYVDDAGTPLKIDRLDTNSGVRTVFLPNRP